MKKGGIYDKNRYAYNARLLQTGNASFDTRGNDATLGSGVRSHTNVSRASRPQRGYATSSADGRSHTGSDVASVDGFSETASRYSYASSKPRSVAAPLGTGYTERSTMNVWSMNDLMRSDEQLTPTVRIVTKFTWTAFVLQLLCILICPIVLFSPGWGRVETDLRTDMDFRSHVFYYYGLWYQCEVKQYEEYIGDLDCLNSIIISFESWFTICQVFSVMFTVHSISVFVMLCFYAFRRQSRRKWPLSLGISIVGSINALLQAVVVILFAINFLDETWWCCPNNNQIDDAILFWGWYLAAVALLFQVVAVIMMIVETVNLRR